MLYGRLNLSRDNIAILIGRFKDDSDTMKWPCGDTFLDAVHLLEFRKHFLLDRKPIDLLDAMMWSVKTLATDLRDKMFALLGLCHDGTTFVLVPNYRQPLETILINMSKAMMNLNRSLDLTCLKGCSLHLEEHSKLPSWVPNWPKIWHGSMTIQETNFRAWHTRYSFNPILDGLNDKPKGEGEIINVKHDWLRFFSCFS